MRKDRIDALGIVTLTLFSVLMGLNQVMIKMVNAGMEPVFQAGLRSLLAFIVVYAWSSFSNKPLNIRDGSFWPGVVAGTLFAFEFLLMFLALDYTAVSRASVFFYTMPLWVVIGAHFLIPSERITPIRVAGLVLAIAGIVVALWDPNAEVGELAWVGDVMCIVGAMFWAGITLVAKTTKLSDSCPEQALLYQLSVSAPILLGLSPLFGEAFRGMTPQLWSIFAFQVLIVVGFGFSLFFWALQRYPAGSMASFSFLAPVFGVIFGWLILSEKITPSILIALAMVCTGVVLVNRK